MRRRRYLLIVIVLGAAAATLLAAFVTRREPTYHGRVLSSWMKQYDRPASLGRKEQAADAVRHIGTNAFPYLLKWIAYEPPAWKMKLFESLSRFVRLEDKQESRAARAMRVFLILGPEGKGAIGDLTRLTTDPKAKAGAWRAAYSLGYVGSDALPALLAGLTNQQGRLRDLYAEVLGAMGTNARPAVPMLIQCLKDQDTWVARSAAAALGTLKIDPALVVPALTNCLQDSRGQVRFWAAYALGEFGADARAAAPALGNVLNDSDPKIRATAKKALRKLDPAALEKKTPIESGSTEGR